MNSDTLTTGAPADYGGTWVLILAAGASRRMGSPKQLLVWDGQPLVCRMVRIAQAVAGSRVLVVTGCCAENVEHALAPTGARRLFNAQWPEGLASSIRAGIAAMPVDCEGALICSCDQPGVEEDALRSLLAHVQPGRVVTASYAGTVGIPAWFAREYFPALLALTGGQGAKSLLLECEQRIDVAMPLASLDLDEPGDIEQAARAMESNLL